MSNRNNNRKDWNKIETLKNRLSDKFFELRNQLASYEGEHKVLLSFLFHRGVLNWGVRPKDQTLDQWIFEADERQEDSSIESLELDGLDRHEQRRLMEQYLEPRRDDLREVLVIWDLFLDVHRLRYDIFLEGESTKVNWGEWYIGSTQVS